MADVARWQSHDGVELLHLTALEGLGNVCAFFTGRNGGVSARWQRGLNWSYSVGDEPAAVGTNRRLTLASMGLPPNGAVMAGLVHGNRVVSVSGATATAPGQDDVRLVPDCDALITDRPGIALVVTAADCVPVFLYDPVRKAIGAIHAGWRGTVAGIAGRAVASMVQQYGCNPSDIRGAIGPSIGPCCYEVDDAVALPLREHYGKGAEDLLLPGRAPGKYQLDLWAANRLDMERAGVGEVYLSGECTSCGVERLFSHRAEAGTAGRGAAVIALV
jgi:YfiH family protein